jgi:hypothetical protein
MDVDTAISYYKKIGEAVVKTCPPPFLYTWEKLAKCY